MRLTDFEVLSFDCYGTLIDWETGLLDAMRPLVTRGPRAIDDDTVLEAFGRAEARQQSATPTKAYPDILAIVYKRLAECWDSPASWEDCVAFGRSVGDWPAFPDSVDALAILKRHFKLVILSNVDNASFARSNARLGVTFDAVYTAEDIGSYKPDARNFTGMLDHLKTRGIESARVLHTAQSLFHDHVPAAAHGLSRCWIDRRHGRPGPGATPVPADVPAIDFQFDSLAAMADALRREL